MQCALDIADFYRPHDDPKKLSLGKLNNLVEMFDAQRTSWLSHARQNDTEAYREAREAGLISAGKPKTETFEMGVQEQQLAAIYVLLQQLITVTARVPKNKQRSPQQWPWPRTAADVVSIEDARAGFESVMADVVFVPREQWERGINDS